MDTPNPYCRLTRVQSPSATCHIVDRLADGPPCTLCGKEVRSNWRVVGSDFTVDCIHCRKRHESLRDSWEEAHEPSQYDLADWHAAMFDLMANDKVKLILWGEIGFVTARLFIEDDGGRFPIVATYQVDGAYSMHEAMRDLMLQLQADNYADV